MEGRRGRGRTAVVVRRVRPPCVGVSADRVVGVVGGGSPKVLVGNARWPRQIYSSWEGGAEDQEGGAAPLCVAVPAWRVATGGRLRMFASQTSWCRVAKAASESPGWKAVEYP